MHVLHVAPSVLILLIYLQFFHIPSHVLTSSFPNSSTYPSIILILPKCLLTESIAMNTSKFCLRTLDPDWKVNSVKASSLMTERDKLLTTTSPLCIMAKAHLQRWDTESKAIFTNRWNHFVLCIVFLFLDLIMDFVFERDIEFTMRKKKWTWRRTLRRWWLWG